MDSGSSKEGNEPEPAVVRPRTLTLLGDLYCLAVVPRVSTGANMHEDTRHMHSGVEATFRGAFASTHTCLCRCKDQVKTALVIPPLPDGIKNTRSEGTYR